MELAVFVGLPGAGKSTFYRSRLEATHLVVSNDLLGKNKKHHAALVAGALAAGRSVAVDDTNATLATRAALLAIAREHGATAVAYWFDEPAKSCLSRNAQREGRAKVPPVAILSAAKRLVPPTTAEGFARVYRVRLGPQSGEFAVEAVDPPSRPAPPSPPGSSPEG